MREGPTMTGRDENEDRKSQVTVNRNTKKHT